MTEEETGEENLSFEDLKGFAIEYLEDMLDISKDDATTLADYGFFRAKGIVEDIPRDVDMYAAMFGWDDAKMAGVLAAAKVVAEYEDKEDVEETEADDGAV